MIDSTAASFQNRSGSIRFEASVVVGADLSIQISAPHDASTVAAFAQIAPDDTYFTATFMVDGKRVVAEEIGLERVPVAEADGAGFVAQIDTLTFFDQAPNDHLELLLNVGFDTLVEGLGILGSSFETSHYGRLEVTAVDSQTCRINSALKTGIAHPHLKIVEVLRFLTGIDLAWTEAKVAGKRMMRRPAVVGFTSAGVSPLPLGDRPAATKMFDAVCEFVAKNLGTSGCDELETTANIRQASACSTNHRLVLGAAVEHLLKRFPGRMAPTAAALQLIDDSLFLIENAKLHPSIKEKLCSALVNQRKIQPKHVLVAMKAAGLIDSVHIKAYETIRQNPPQLEGMRVKEAADSARKALVVLDLIYRLLLNGIGYSGKYRNPPKNADATFKCAVIG